MTIRVIAYYRVSTTTQAVKENIEIQKMEREEDLLSLGEDCELIGEYQDDGISGEEIAKRPEFQQALERIREGDVDILWVYMVDRIGRFKSRKDRNQVIELLEESQTSVRSPYDGDFLWDSEERMNDLEKLLNESRAENKRRGQRTHRGFWKARKQGKLRRGGSLPYVFDEKTQEIVDERVQVMATVFDMLKKGYSYHSLADYFNADLEKYPKKVRRYKGKPVTKWSAGYIRSQVWNDFYFTGVIKCTDKAKKGQIDVDTGIKLFPKDLVLQARRAGRQRQWSRKYGIENHPPFALFRGIAKCGHCGWTLGRQPANKNGRFYCSYKCWGRAKRLCDFREISARKLDKILWEAFIGVLQDPEQMQAHILAEDFLTDREREEQKGFLLKAEKGLEGYEESLKLLKEQYHVFRDYTKEEYLERRARYVRLIERKQDEIAKLRQVIQRPAEVAKSVKRATEVVAKEVELVSSLTRLAGNFHLREKPITFPPKTKARIRKIRGEEILDKYIFKPGEMSNEDLSKMIFQQKRLILQEYIDGDKGIEVVHKVKGMPSFRFHFSIESSQRIFQWKAQR
jgi:site-specific DNA recombinase